MHYAKVALRGGVPVVSSVGATSACPGGLAVVMFAASDHLALASGTAAVASEIGGAAFASTNWLGYEKRGLTLLKEDCLENGTFLLSSFSISLILFSKTMALSTMCWKSA
jgi:hypothetical protein